MVDFIGKVFFYSACSFVPHPPFLPQEILMIFKKREKSFFSRFFNILNILVCIIFNYKIKLNHATHFFNEIKIK